MESNETGGEKPALWQATHPAGGAWASLLSRDPLIVHTWYATGFPLGAASALGPRLRHRKAHFIITPPWTTEPPGHHEFVLAKMQSYMVDHPLHRLTFLGNTDRETRLMREAGINAITVNHNCLMNDAVFRPLPEVSPIYDAVYNARISPQKRLELAAEIERLAIIFSYDTFEFTLEQFHAEHARLSALMPRAKFLNSLTSEGHEWFSAERVNSVLAQSRIGLCLSPVEGAMRASIEYLFAGLSVVSTPSLGGRDVYFDDEYCIIAEPDPGSIRDAVKALLARAVPRDYVRARTLARVEADRSRYIAFVQSLIDEAGGHENFADRFWSLTRTTTIMHWRSMPEFAQTVMASLPASGTIDSAIHSSVTKPNPPRADGPPPVDNQARAEFLEGKQAPWHPNGQATDTWTSMLSTAPLIIHTKPSLSLPLGIASVLGPLLRNRKAHFLLTPSWTIEPPDKHESLIASLRSYAADHPLHRLTFLGNTDRETQLMAEAGFEAFTLNQNCYLNDAVFRPLPGILPIYDAVYNARLSPFKRTELAGEIDSLALIYFYHSREYTVPEFHAEHARLGALMPHARFVNRLTPEGCEWLPCERVNTVLAQSHIGLCLSFEEGTMKASMEYLLAGLSLVSTPSIGGRDVYFDDEYCIIADPDPRSIRNAVKTLAARAVPRDYVRAQTLARVESDRARYIAFVQSLIDEAGGHEVFVHRFWELTRDRTVMNWRPVSEFTQIVMAALHRTSQPET